MAKFKCLEEATITIKYFCPKEQRKVSRALQADEFSSSSSECGSCGSHGHLGVTFKCRACNREHTFDMQSW